MSTTPETKEHSGRAASVERTRVLQAVDLFNAGRFDLAMQSARAAVAANHSDAQAHAILASSLAQLDRGREALAEAQTAVALDPLCALAHSALADALIALGLRWDAELAAREALRLDPTDVNVIAELAIILLGSGRYEEVLAATEQILRSEPQHVRALRMRALALASLNRPNEALALLSGALANEPDSEYTHTAVGLALEKSANLDAAAVAFREALRINPRHEPALKAIRRVTGRYRWVVPAHVVDRVRSRILWRLSRPSLRGRVLELESDQNTPKRGTSRGDGGPGD